MIASADPWWSIPAFIVPGVALYWALGWVVLRKYRWFKGVAQASEQRAFEGLSVENEPGRGLVAVEFQTYYGFIAFLEQTEHFFWASPDVAREALWRPSGLPPASKDVGPP